MRTCHFIGEWVVGVAFRARGRATVLRTRLTSRPAGILALLRAPQLGRRALTVVVNLFVAAIVMSLPFIASSASTQPTQSSFAAGGLAPTRPPPPDSAPHPSP